MQTVYQSIVLFLNSIVTDPENEFPPKTLFIDLEIVGTVPNAENAGIFSSPNDIATELMAGGAKHIEFKSFYLRMPFNSFPQRLSNEAYLEKLRKCIREKNLDGIDINDGRDWISISINAGIYPAQREANMSTAEYLVPLKLEYIE